MTIVLETTFIAQNESLKSKKLSLIQHCKKEKK